MAENEGVRYTKKALKEAGIVFHIEHGSKHARFIVDGVLVQIVSRGSTAFKGEGRALKNLEAQVKRFIRNYQEVPDEAHQHVHPGQISLHKARIAHHTRMH